MRKSTYCTYRNDKGQNEGIKQEQQNKKESLRKVIQEDEYSGWRSQYDDDSFQSCLASIGCQSIQSRFRVVKQIFPTFFQRNSVLNLCEQSPNRNYVIKAFEDEDEKQ